jgi:hypothetical protein
VSIVTSLVIVAVVCTVLFGTLVLENRRRQNRTVEEFEADVRAGQSFGASAMRVAMLEMDRCLKPSVAIVAETTEAQKRLAEADDEGDDPDAIDRWRIRARSVRDERQGGEPGGSI